MTETSRAEHLEWCKRRALKYVDAGQLHDALMSMHSDLNKHPDTKGHSAMGLGLRMHMAGLLDSPQAMREHIEGFL